MINLFKNLNPLAFIFAFVIGMVYCYYKKPARKVVYRYPTPKNIDKTVYQNNNNQCYKYTMKEVDCPQNKELISDLEIQVE